MSSNIQAFLDSPLYQSQLDNFQSAQSLPELPQWYITMLLLACILITLPNAILFVALVRMKNLRKTVSNCLIISFTFSDLFTGITLFPLGIIHEIEYVERYRYEKMTLIQQWKHLSSHLPSILFNHSIPTSGVTFHDGHFHFSGEHASKTDMNDEVGEGFCDLLQASVNCLGYVSMWHMTVIAMDRYYRITCPIRWKKLMTRNRALIIVSAIWVFGLLLAVFLWWVYKRSGIPYEPSQCVIYIITNIYAFIFAIIIGFGPLCLWIWYYIRLIALSRYRIPSTFLSHQPSCPRSQQQNCIPLRPMTACFMRQTSASSSDSEDDADDSSVPSCCRSQEQIMQFKIHSKRAKRSKRATVLLGLILVAYIACVFPPSTVWFLYTFWPQLEIHKTTFIYLYPWMTFFNSAINPWIYFFLTKDLRKVALEWFRSKIRRN